MSTGTVGHHWPLPGRLNRCECAAAPSNREQQRDLCVDPFWSMPSSICPLPLDSIQQQASSPASDRRTGIQAEEGQPSITLACQSGSDCRVCSLQPTGHSERAPDRSRREHTSLSVSTWHSLAPAAIQGISELAKDLLAARSRHAVGRPRPTVTARRRRRACPCAAGRSPTSDLRAAGDPPASAARRTDVHQPLRAATESSINCSVRCARNEVERRRSGRRQRDCRRAVELLAGRRRAAFLPPLPVCSEARGRGLDTSSFRLRHQLVHHHCCRRRSDTARRRSSSSSSSRSWLCDCCAERAPRLA